jgi:hypothetical protein
MARVELREILTEGDRRAGWGCGEDRVRTRTWIRWRKSSSLGMADAWSASR